MALPEKDALLYSVPSLQVIGTFLKTAMWTLLTKQLNENLPN